MPEKKRIRLPKVTEKQRAYCRLRLKNPHWPDWKCYKEAYDPKMTDKNAMSNAWRLKENDGVIEYLKALRDRIDDEFTVSMARVKEELACIAFVNSKDFYDEEGNLITVQSLSDEAARALQAKATDKNKALETLTKMEGGFEKDNTQSQQVVILKPDVLEKPKESGV